MTAVDFLGVVRARPFRPFRVFLLDNVACEVRHPNLVIVGRGEVFIGYPSPTVEGAAQRVDIIGLEAVSRIEFIDQPQPAAQGNGSV